ncbi:MAG: kelch repeat-containing protein, partial [Ginsengibacter sp.]
YQFELKVTDNAGLSAKDTIQINVNAVTSSNIPPVADAGSDIEISYDYKTCTLSPSSITLNGSASHDVDGNIVSYLWSYLSLGPATIVSPNLSTTLVKDFIFISYTFILQVTDNNGAVDNDTMMITIKGTNRQQINAQLIPLATLSETRNAMAVASSGNKILFAGGYTGAGPSSRVDIYDITTNTWSTAALSKARYDISAAALNNKIYFAGGSTDGPNRTGALSTIDIYDVTTNIWSTAQLSQPRGLMAAAAAGNKILFAGGYIGIINVADVLFSNRVDIYDATTNQWSTSSLSMARSDLTADAAGNKIYFAGGTNLLNLFDYGCTERIDIYDAVASSWSTASLSEAKGGHASIQFNGKIYWAGGRTNTSVYPYSSNKVEIKDVSSQSLSLACLFQPNAFFNAVEKNNKIAFFTGEWGNEKNKFDIYDITTNTWFIGLLSQTFSGASIISVNNVIYVAGGSINGIASNNVWKLDF